MEAANIKEGETKVNFLGKLNALLLAIIVAVALGVVYSTHQSRLLTSQHSTLLGQIEKQNMKHTQLKLEEGTFARTAIVERKSREELQLQKITLER